MGARCPLLPDLPARAACSSRETARRTGRSSSRSATTTSTRPRAARRGLRAENFCSPIITSQKIPLARTLLPDIYDYILWYAGPKDGRQAKFHQLFEPREHRRGTRSSRGSRLPDGARPMTDEERRKPADAAARALAVSTADLVIAGGQRAASSASSSRARRITRRAAQELEDEPERHGRAHRGSPVYVSGRPPRYVLYADDYPVQELTNVWTDTQGRGRRSATSLRPTPKVIERCMLMTTDPGDLVLDPTCGSGTTAMLRSSYGRRWITIDTSRVALASRARAAAHRRRSTTTAGSIRGVVSRTASPIPRSPTSRSGRSPRREGHPPRSLYDQPQVDTAKVRVSGPFTVEALSRYADNPFADSLARPTTRSR